MNGANVPSTKRSKPREMRSWSRRQRREASPRQLVWMLAWSEPVETEARDMAQAESKCCSFFAFELERQGAELRWSMMVPWGREETLALPDCLVGSPSAHA